MKKLLFIFLIFNLPNFGFACSCFSISKKEARKISREADYVLLGYPIENIHPNDTIKGDWDRLQKGYHVKFKVEKVFKGRIDMEFIFINQFETGNCLQVFEFGKKCIIVGTQVKEFVGYRPANSPDEHVEDKFSQIFPPPPPHPIAWLNKNEMISYNEEKLVVDYWNEIAKNGIVVYTNQCSTFDEKSTYGKYFA
jgi:multimeric flavodoxin WrbA